jgi:hypothetical protein
MKPLSCLEKRGGAFRKRVFGFKTILYPTCNDFVYFCKTVLKKSDNKAMLKETEFDYLRKEVLKKLIANLEIDVKDVQGLCDDRGINMEEYESLFNVLRKGMLNGGIKKILVPHPFHVQKECGLRNKKKMLIIWEIHIN